MTMADLDECASQIAELRRVLMSKKASIDAEQLETFAKKLVEAENFVQSRRNMMIDDIASDEEVRSLR